jgi:DtxR family transcriptional regulator, Mn-dependent transcriptional regulator
MMELSSSQEMYLKTVYQLCDENKVARVKDIAARLNVTMSSVNGAIKALASLELCTHSRYGYIDLTELGEKTARIIIANFEMLTRLLSEVFGVDKESAMSDACGMEHIVSVQTLDRIGIFLDFIKDEQSGTWLNDYRSYLEKRLEE